MPKNKVSDPITDQEMAFARLILAGSMTDRHAAEAVGLNPDSAAYTKSKPRVRDYMLQHRAAVQQQLAQQEADALRRLNLDREQVLARLWEIANLGPEMTRGSITGQVKALSMIVAMQNFIPDRRGFAAEKKPTPAPTPQIYNAAWLREQQATKIDPQPGPAPQQEKVQRQEASGCPATERAPNSAAEAPPNPGPNPSTFAAPFSLPEAPPLAPYVRGVTHVPDLRVPFSTKVNPFARPG